MEQNLTYLFRVMDGVEISFVCIIYCLDPQRTAKGRLSLKALRLTPTMMSMYHEGDFTHEASVYLN